MASILSKRKSFPSPLSAWWIPVLLGIGWLPFLGADAAGSLWPSLNQDTQLVGFMMAWGFDVGLSCSVLTAISIAVQIVRLAQWEMRQGEPKD